jgi:hypothetical protein
MRHKGKLRPKEGEQLEIKEGWLDSQEPTLVFQRVYHCCGNDQARITILEAPDIENVKYGLYDKEAETYSASDFKKVMKDALVGRGELLAFFLMNTSTGKKTKVLVSLPDWPDSAGPITRTFRTPITVSLKKYLDIIS